jgi:hypothetical protein
MVRDIWREDYSRLDVHAFSPRDDDGPPTKKPRFFDPFAVNDHSQGSRYTAVIGDEYEVWQRDRETGDSDVRNPFAYWTDKQELYPRLSKMVMDFLTIQPMSAECERVFSATGKMVSSTRARLDASVIGIY